MEIKTALDTVSKDLHIRTNVLSLLLKKLQKDIAKYFNVNECNVYAFEQTCQRRDLCMPVITIEFESRTLCSVSLKRGTPFILFVKNLSEKQEKDITSIIEIAVAADY